MISEAGDSGLEEKRRRMTHDPVEMLVIRLAGPTVAIMLVTALYNTADTYFVGSLGTSATGAVGIAFPLMAIIQAVGFFFGQGGGNSISRQLGARNFGRAGRMAATSFLLSLIFGALIAILGIARIRNVAVFLGSTETILPHALEYLAFILLAAPLTCGSFALNNLLRFQGSAFHGMLGMLSGAFLNIVLDPICIFWLDMGVSGASFATMVSQGVSFLLLLFNCARGGNIQIVPGLFAPDWEHLREISRGGFPSLSRQGMMSVAAVCLNQAAGVFGDPAIAAMAVVQRITMIANAALIGLGQGFQPVCGFNYGAGAYSRVKQAFRFCLKTSACALAVMAMAGYFFAPEIIALFRADDPEVIGIGGTALRLRCLTYPLVAWIILNNMLLQTIGRAKPASFLALAWQGLFMIPFLFALPPWLGILGIQLSQPLSDLATFVCSLYLGLAALQDMRQDRAAE
ncbi:MAG: MATE family efflux transporter [Planctomycetota bacterium]|jgi:putative MATE family efflux protein|nr:MATE family efflux transporter [Planctomycetota bacterium]